MIFTSKRPEDFDPEPWRHPESEGRSPFNVHDRWVYVPRPHFQPTRDPEPWHQSWPGLRCSSAPQEGWGWEPRPEFTTPSNPILIEVRSAASSLWDSSPTTEAELWLNAIDDTNHPSGIRAFAQGDRDFVLACTPEQIEHARKVLTRLVVLS